jgi:hypothetical protein
LHDPYQHGHPSICLRDYSRDHERAIQECVLSPVINCPSLMNDKCRAKAAEKAAQKGIAAPF